jgi:hypothetical protein
MGLITMGASTDRVADIGCIRDPNDMGYVAVCTFEVQLPPGDMKAEI